MAVTSGIHLQHAETNSTHHRDRSTDDDGSRRTLARLYAGEQPDRVMEERFAKPTSRQNKETKTKRRKKVAKTRAFDPSDIVKGRRGIPVKKSTTFMSLVRGVWWGKKPLLELLDKRVRLVDDQFLNKRTTLLSLVRNMPMAKKPLVDVIVNKML